MEMYNNFQVEKRRPF